jgi:hypothetical protein
MGRVVVPGRAAAAAGEPVAEPLQRGQRGPGAHQRPRAALGAGAADQVRPHCIPHLVPATRRREEVTQLIHGQAADAREAQGG